MSGIPLERKGNHLDRAATLALDDGTEYLVLPHARSGNDARCVDLFVTVAPGRAVESEDYAADLDDAASVTLSVPAPATFATCRFVERTLHVMVGDAEGRLHLFRDAQPVPRGICTGSMPGANMVRVATHDLGSGDGQDGDGADRSEKMPAIAGGAWCASRCLEGDRSRPLSPSSPSSSIITPRPPQVVSFLAWTGPAGGGGAPRVALWSHKAAVFANCTLPHGPVRCAAVDASGTTTAVITARGGCTIAWSAEGPTVDPIPSWSGVDPSLVRAVVALPAPSLFAVGTERPVVTSGSLGLAASPFLFGVSGTSGPAGDRRGGPVTAESTTAGDPAGPLGGLVIPSRPSRPLNAFVIGADEPPPSSSSAAVPGHVRAIEVVGEVPEGSALSSSPSPLTIDPSAPAGPRHGAGTVPSSPSAHVHVVSIVMNGGGAVPTEPLASVPVRDLMCPDHLSSQERARPGAPGSFDIRVAGRLSVEVQTLRVTLADGPSAAAVTAEWVAHGHGGRDGHGKDVRRNDEGASILGPRSASGARVQGVCGPWIMAGVNVEPPSFSAPRRPRHRVSLIRRATPKAAAAAGTTESTQDPSQAKTILDAIASLTAIVETHFGALRSDIARLDGRVDALRRDVDILRKQ